MENKFQSLREKGAPDWGKIGVEFSLSRQENESLSSSAFRRNQGKVEL